MRQRNIKNLDERIEASSTYLVRNPKELKGKWHEAFGNNSPIYLEIGSGKGQFIMKKALANPDINYIAVEGQANVGFRILEKTEEAKLSNVLCFLDFIHDINEYFEKGEIAGIYLNFSDPWRKARQAKRRLTYRDNIKRFKDILDGGMIEFKTDNEDLFEFSLEEINYCGYEIIEMTRNLHGSDSHYESKNFTTEYEDKFIRFDKNINYIKF